MTLKRLFLLCTFLLVPMVCFVGCGDSDDDDDPPAADPAAEAATCDNDDATGTWRAPDEIDGTITRKYSININSDGSAGYSTVTEDSGPPPTAMGAATMGTWTLDGCYLDLDNSPFGGGGTINGDMVEVGGRTFFKD